MRSEYLSPEQWKKYIEDEDIPVQCIAILKKKIKETQSNNVALKLDESIAGTNYYIHTEQPNIGSIKFYKKQDYLSIADEIISKG